MEDLKLWVMICLLAVGLTLTSLPTYAQKKNIKREAALNFRATAINSLDLAIDDLREIEPLALRISLAGEIVKLLRNDKPARCRQLLDGLFDKLLAERAKQKNDDTKAQQDTISLLQGIIKIAATIDDELAQSYIEKYAAQEKLRDSEATAKPPANSVDSDLYLKLATELTQTNPPLALTVATQTLKVPLTSKTLIFLTALRSKESRLANRFLELALQSVAERRGADINELFLLYSYTFSLSRVLYVTPQGIGALEIPEYREIFANYPPEPTTAKMYLLQSARIILEPTRYGAGFESLSAGAYGDLAFLRVIEPQLAGFAPELQEPLAAQRATLTAGLAPDTSSSLQERLDRWGVEKNQTSSPQEKPASVEALLKRAEKETDANFRDQLLYEAANLLVKNKDYARAHEVSGKLSEQTRAEAEPFINFLIAEAELRSGNIERTEEWARRDKDIVRRAYILTRLAEVLTQTSETNTPRIVELLNEVEQASAKVENQQERIAVLLGAASVYGRFDARQAGNLLRDVFRAVDKTENFAVDANISRRLQIGDYFHFYTLYGSALGLTEVVRKQSAANFNATLSDIQTLNHRAVRVKAILVLCGTVLPDSEPKKLTNHGQK
jgi:hypothetical protein